MNVLFLGATGGLGSALARALAAEGHRLVLLGRDPRRLAAAADELGGAVVGVVPCDLRRPETLAGSVDRATSMLSSVDAAIAAAGVFGPQEALEDDADRRLELLETNFRGTIEWCERVRGPLLADGGGVLCVYTSVAADRPRAKVALYGATKAGLDAYLDGIDLRWRDAGLRVVRVKPGFVRTSMTRGLDEPPFTCDPERTVPHVLRAIRRGTRCVYTPPVWRWVMFVVKRLPRAVLKRSGI